MDTPKRHAAGECTYHDGQWSCWPSSISELIATSDALDRETSMYALASEHFRHDLTQFWNHSTFFALLQGGLISVAVTSLGPQQRDSEPGVLQPEQVAASIAVFGLLFAGFWAMVAWRRSVLIQRWREQVEHLDGRVNPHASYLRIEGRVATYWWYGPTKLIVTLPFLIGGIWLVVLAALHSRDWAVVVVGVESAAFLTLVVKSWNNVRKTRNRAAHPPAGA